MQSLIAAIETFAESWAILPAAGLCLFIVAWRLRKIAWPLRKWMARRWQRRDITLAWLARNYVWLIIVAALAVYGCFWGYIGWLLPGALRGMVEQIPGLLAGADYDALRNLAMAIAAILGALGVLAAIPFQLVKTWVNERTARTAEQGHITERLTEAIEMLGTVKAAKFRAREITYSIISRDGPTKVSTLEKAGEPDDIPEDADDVVCQPWQTLEETRPNLEVRLGAIYALERISQDSERDHIPIMETLCAYIRENAKAETAKPHGLGDFPPFPRSGDYEAVEAWETAHQAHGDKLQEWVLGLAPPRVDIQAALTVIGRRSSRRREHEEAKGYRLDLRKTNLRRADLNHAHLEAAKLDGTHLEGAQLDEAHLERSWLRGAHLEDASLELARLQHARLQGSHFEHSRLYKAHLGRASFANAHMHRARLGYATLDGVEFGAARLAGWQIHGTSLRNASFQYARDLEFNSLAEAFGVHSGPGATVLPNHFPSEAIPAHWHVATEAEDGPRAWASYEAAYQAWLTSGTPHSPR